MKFMLFFKKILAPIQPVNKKKTQDQTSYLQRTFLLGGIVFYQTEQLQHWVYLQDTTLPRVVVPIVMQA
jgi:hypothetical protein